MPLRFFRFQTLLQVGPSRLRTALLLLMALLAIGGIAPTIHAQVVTTLHRFIGLQNGEWPQAGLIRGKDGALYGTTTRGGADDNGTLFKMNPDGTGYRVLHSFTFSRFPEEGTNPGAALLLGHDGALYGTTQFGGANGVGTLFKLPPGANDPLTLFSFTGAEGARPYAPLIQGRDGALYGTTSFGGIDNMGTVFRVNSNGTGAIRLHSFSGDDGNLCYSALLQRKDGTLYGTTFYGGTHNKGTLFKLNPDGSGFAIVHSFTGISPEGASSYCAVIQGRDGALYGTTSFGGFTDPRTGLSLGTVFKINPDGSGLVTLHSFTHTDGANPGAALLQGRDGGLYGTTIYGGDNNLGTLFKINPDGTGYALLHSFVDSEGTVCYNALLQGPDDGLYGIAYYGGINNRGTLFKINPDGTGLTTLHTFGSDGAAPLAAVIQGPDNALYGTTFDGGTSNVGMLFKVNPDGTGMQTLLSFNTQGTHPAASLLSGADGGLYGTTFYGGDNNLGTLFKINPDGTGYALLHSFTDSEGANPYCALIQDPNGALYGAASNGGTFHRGTLFAMNPDGTGYQVLHTFTNVDGEPANPYGALLQAADGYLYGTTYYGGVFGYGTLFKMRGDGLGYRVLHSFTGDDGANPQAAVFQGRDGVLYGTTVYGGSRFCGTVYRVTTEGTDYRVLHSFTNTDSDGLAPHSAVIQGTDGALYGVTEQGGTNGQGTVFHVNPDGSGFVTLHSFAGSEGSNPIGALLQGADSALYGSTRFGLPYNLGTLFRISLPPISVTGLTVLPNPAAGGRENPTGTVTLLSPAPKGGAVVLLTSGNVGAATVPASVTVPAGATSATFPVTTKKVPSNVTTRITATYNGSKQSPVLTVTH